MSQQRPANLILARKLNYWAVGISIIVLALVGAMRRFKVVTEIDFGFLPAVYSGINILVAITLVLALVYVRRKDIDKHKKAMSTAMILSGLFLLLYVVYHFTTEATTYCGEGGIRTLYFILLISHIILAATIFPFILFTYIRGYTWQTEKHRKMAKWVFPLWLYVALSGPLVYIMLLPCM
ncbi:MAG: DUF420 domain-containing protein [Bacteroidia bacterium]|nr:DUF420 domain-containing protein [Bacteroidia bacterium]